MHRRGVAMVKPGWRLRSVSGVAGQGIEMAPTAQVPMPRPGAIEQHSLDFCSAALLCCFPADQAWFWTERWQQLEREADNAVSAGCVTVVEDIDELLAELDS